MGKLLREARLLRVWLLLCAVTLLSWSLGMEHAEPDTMVSAAVSYSVLLIAALKVRVIVVEFMEARRASKKLLLVMDTWLLLLIGTLTAIYTFKIGMPPV